MRPNKTKPGPAGASELLAAAIAANEAVAHLSLKERKRVFLFLAGYVR